MKLFTTLSLIHSLPNDGWQCGKIVELIRLSISHILDSWGTPPPLFTLAHHNIPLHAVADKSNRRCIALQTASGAPGVPTTRSVLLLVGGGVGGCNVNPNRVALCNWIPNNFSKALLLNRFVDTSSSSSLSL